MGQHFYARTGRVRNPDSHHGEIVVNDEFPYRALSIGQVDLLDRVPTTGSTIDLDEALVIVGNNHSNPYAQIVILMNRGLMVADFEDGPHVDPEIVLRRI